MQTSDALAESSVSMPMQGFSDPQPPVANVMAQSVAAATSSMADYTVTVHTSDLPGAGTDCSAYIVVHGKAGDSGQQGLNPARGAFVRGMSQTCTVQGANVGRMQFIQIGHHDDGMQ